MGLSVCMIAKNEAHCIANAINSVLPIADEIIVVDTGSTDGTPAIVRDLVGRVYFSAWQDDFAHARNVSLSLCTCDWVLWLDCDDIVPETSYMPILQAMLAGNNNFHGALIKNIGVADIGLVKFEEFKQARLFPRKSGVVFEGRVHETFSIAALREGLNPVESLDIVIEHHGYKDRFRLDEKRKRNIRLQLQQMGFPSKTDYYEFDYKGCFCLFAPSALVVWNVLDCIGVIDVIFNENEDKHKQLENYAEILIQRHAIKKEVANELVG